MKRILVIDQDRAAMEKLGLACLERNVGVTMADNVCEAVRVLLAEPVSFVLVDGLELRFGARESATLFERVAPGVPVVVMVRPETDLSRIVQLELAGFKVVTKPVIAADLMAKVAADMERTGR
jgi:DNA-binding response OmpR family regulator